MYTILDTKNIHETHKLDMKYMYNPQQQISIDLQRIEIGFMMSLQ